MAIVRNLNSMEDITKQIREILMSDWDPIGVKDITEAQDEYDMYISEIKSLILKKASSEEISEHLTWIERERMGFSKPHEIKITNAVAKLSNLR